MNFCLPVFVGPELLFDSSTWLMFQCPAPFAAILLLQDVFFREFDVTYSLKCKVSIKKNSGLLLNIIYFCLLCTSKYFYIDSLISYCAIGKGNRRG